MSRQYPLGNNHARQFKRLCRAMIVTYPFLLHRPARNDRLIPVAHVQEHETEWTTTPADAGIAVSLNGNTRATSGVLHTMGDCDGYAQQMLQNPNIKFHAHPSLTRLVQVWGGATRWKPSRRLVAKVAGASRRQVGKDERLRREERYEQLEGPMANGLGLLSWMQLHHMRPRSSTELQTYYRLKSGSLAYWTGDRENDDCMHTGCLIAEPCTAAHCFWTCTAATDLWKTNMHS